MQLICLALFGAAPAWADDLEPGTEAALERGKELYDNGVILYDEGRYEDAIVAWSEAHRLTERSGFLFNIANAQERLGDYAAAIETLGRYRALAHADERATLDRRLRNLEARMAAEAPPVTPAPVPQPVVSTVGGPNDEILDPKGTTNPRRWVGAGLLAAGAASAAVGTGFGIRSRGAGVEALAACAPGDVGTLCSGGASDPLAVNRGSAVVADVGFAAGAVLSTVGVVLLLSGGTTRAPTPWLRWRSSPTGPTWGSGSAADRGAPLPGGEEGGDQHARHRPGTQAGQVGAVGQGQAPRRRPAVVLQPSHRCGAVQPRSDAPDTTPAHSRPLPFPAIGWIAGLSGRAGSRSIEAGTVELAGSGAAGSAATGRGGGATKGSVGAGSAGAGAAATGSAGAGGGGAGAGAGGGAGGATAGAGAATVGAEGGAIGVGIGVGSATGGGGAGNAATGVGAGTGAGAGTAGGGLRVTEAGSAIGGAAPRSGSALACGGTPGAKPRAIWVADRARRSEGTVGGPPCR